MNSTRPSLARQLAAAALLLGLVAQPFLAAEPPQLDEPPTGQANKYDARLEPVITGIMRAEKIPGFAIGVVEDDRLIYSRGFGEMKLGEPSRLVTPETLFHMASITKPFVATAVMQLVEQGKVDLTAPVTIIRAVFSPERSSLQRHHRPADGDAHLRHAGRQGLSLEQARI
jgi:CubicO group peptidase (beta-lactamase class C family)